MTKYVKIINREMLGRENHNSLLEFMYNYMQTHVYCSRSYLSGDYISEIYPEKPNDYKRRQTSIKRKIGVIFRILGKSGLVSQFNTSTIEVHEKFKQMSLEDILELIEKDS